MTSPADRLSGALRERYRIECELGAGGMATVYLAEDLKHDRKVAIKVLKPELAAVLGAERFVVEIKTTAAMSHPHILPLFDSGTADGFLFYVMPYIEGETIRDKLNRETQFGVDGAVRIAREIADALDYAHRHGVIHRDIKPENILLHDGRAMVMDFGIALAVSAAAGGRMTETGLSLGTPHYMSPEQATAEKEITARSDQYSLASVLYEMLAGQPPHNGGAAQQVIMKIITEQAQPVHHHRKNVPANVDAALAKALEKLPADRFESAKGFADALGNSAFMTAGSVGTMAANRSRDGISRRAFAATAALAVLSLGAAAWLALRPAPPVSVTRVSMALPEGEQLGDGTARLRVALSPDGRTIAYVGGPSEDKLQLWVRRLDQLAATPLAGTEGAYNPAFSPDGTRIAYVGTQSSRVLRVVPVGGGPSITVADSLVDLAGVSWGYDGYIYYDGKLAGDGIARVRETGGNGEVATMPDSATGEQWHGYPSALPNGRGVLFTVGRPSLDEYEVAVLDKRTGKHSVLVRGVAGRYASSGHLVYVTAAGALMAAPFDAEELRLIGEPVPIMEGVSVRLIGRAEVEIAANGTLVYVAGGATTTELTWLDREGSATAVDTAFRGRFLGLRVSPDGRAAAFTRMDGTKQSISVKQLDRGPATKIADDGGTPSWSADGSSVLFASRRGIEQVPGDGSRLPEIVVARNAGNGITVSPDGKWIVFGNSGVIYGLAAGDTVPKQLNTGRNARRATISPDGRWLAYDDDATGRAEIVVVPFPETSRARHQVSTTGGTFARWSRDGKTLFFMDELMRQLISVPVTLGEKFSAGSPRAEFSLAGFSPSFDMAPDGRFLALRYVDARGQSGRSDLVLVENFVEELKALAKP